VENKKQSPSRPPIALFDQYGRKLLVNREEWFEKFIQPALSKAWNNPDELSQLLAQAIEQKYAPELDRSSRHLLRIDPNPLRALCIRAAVLLLCDDSLACEKLLKDALQTEPPHPHLLSLLAKSLVLQERYTEVLPLLCQALNLDPNHEEALKLLLRVAHPSKKENLLKELSKNPKATRAKIALADIYLQKKKNEEGLELLKTCARRKESSEEELSQIGELLNSQNLHLERLQLLSDRFQKKKHGILLGRPLTHAFVELGQVDNAKELLETLHKKKSPLWTDELQKLEDLVSQASLEYPENLNPESIELERITINGSIWLNQDPNAQELFHTKEKDCPKFAVLPASVLSKKSENRPKKEPANAAGRLSRILPLLLTEWIEMHTDCQSQAVIPWVKSEGAFALFQEAWQGEDASEWTREHSPTQNNDYTLTLNLHEEKDQWKLEVKILNTLTTHTEKHFWTTLCLDQLVPQLHQLKGLLLHHLQALGARIQNTPHEYNPPEDPNAYLQYAIRLEQCLSCQCAAYSLQYLPEQTHLTGERDIVQHALFACLESPESLPLRLTLLKTLSAIKKINPQAALEFQKPLQWLQKSCPLPSPYQNVLKTKIHSLFHKK